ncbi:MAG: hypothetical protein DRQ55_05985 [Planctomycetota bacterium]|nr:MAG: hypothetical protein DRQ55_05985 [Planctomycetota bacterium]
MYAFEQQGEHSVMHARRSDGGRRTQLVVGRYGAGVFDTSYVGTELDPDGRPTGRLSFLPLEALSGHGLALSPFEALSPRTGFDMPMAAECLQCHSTQNPADLPGASADAESGRVWPDAQLGVDAWEHLSPLGCESCHGPVARHAELKLRSRESGRPSGQLGLERIGELPARRQIDICARCHLQGEGYVSLAPIERGGPQPADMLARRPVLVAAHPGDDFRFVGQVRRLSLSACFEASPAMSCSSCHDPHQAAAAQGTADFDARCTLCHGEGRGCVREPELRVAEVSGDPARSADGCVDCHVRRSQPFDLPGVRTADHFVRRRIPPPASIPVREWEHPGGPLAVYDDGRLSELLARPGGDSWQRGATAMALIRMGRSAEALTALEGLAPPGTAGARVSSAPPGLPGLETAADVQHMRGLLLESSGAIDAAIAAYGDALRLDPSYPQARLNRANLALQQGDLPAAMSDADALALRFPAAEKPWNLRALAVARRGDLRSAVAALMQSANRWPSDADVWHELGRLLLRLGERGPAHDMLKQAQLLDPSREGLAQDLGLAGG